MYSRLPQQHWQKHFNLATRSDEICLSPLPEWLFSYLATNLMNSLKDSKLKKKSRLHPVDVLVVGLSWLRGKDSLTKYRHVPTSSMERSWSETALSGLLPNLFRQLASFLQTWIKARDAKKEFRIGAALLTEDQFSPVMIENGFVDFFRRAHILDGTHTTVELPAGAKREHFLSHKTWDPALNAQALIYHDNWVSWLSSFSAPAGTFNDVKMLTWRLKVRQDDQLVFEYDDSVPSEAELLAKQIDAPARMVMADGGYNFKNSLKESWKLKNGEFPFAVPIRKTARTQLSEDSKHFNNEFGKVRKKIEDFFGHLKARWPRLSKFPLRSLSSLHDCFIVCCALNNIILDSKENPEDWTDYAPVFGCDFVLPFTQFHYPDCSLEIESDKEQTESDDSDDDETHPALSYVSQLQKKEREKRVNKKAEKKNKNQRKRRERAPLLPLVLPIDYSDDADSEEINDELIFSSSQLTSPKPKKKKTKEKAIDEQVHRKPQPKKKKKIKEKGIDEQGHRKPQPKSSPPRGKSSFGRSVRTPKNLYGFQVPYKVKGKIQIKKKKNK